MSNYTPEAWQRLGSLLRSRRVHLDPRYKNRGVFCDETGLNYKLVQDLEGHVRANFTDETFALFETAYRLAEGSIRRTLAGAPLDPIQDPADMVVREMQPPPPPEDAHDDMLDLDSFEPETPLEHALTKILKATLQAVENTRAEHRKELDDVKARLDELTEGRGPDGDNNGQHRNTA